MTGEGKAGLAGAISTETARLPRIRPQVPKDRGQKVITRKVTGRTQESWGFQGYSGRQALALAERIDDPKNSKGVLTPSQARIRSATDDIEKCGQFIGEKVSTRRTEIEGHAIDPELPPWPRSALGCIQTNFASVRTHEPNTQAAFAVPTRGKGQIDPAQIMSEIDVMDHPIQCQATASIARGPGPPRSNFMGAPSVFGNMGVETFEKAHSQDPISIVGQLNQSARLSSGLSDGLLNEDMEPSLDGPGRSA